MIKGKNIINIFKNEFGVHRIQRVPPNESNNRIHTSTSTVAVLSIKKRNNFKFYKSDLKINTCKGSGSGGQHVNTTDSFVRITHLPTGVTVVQGNKSQHQNKNKAMQLLKCKITNIKKK